MKKNSKPVNTNYWVIDATTTNKDWGFIPVPGKGGKTTNFQPDLSASEAMKMCYGRKAVD